MDGKVLVHALMSSSGTTLALLRHPGSNAHSAPGSCWAVQLFCLPFKALVSTGRAQVIFPQQPHQSSYLCTLSLLLRRLAQGTFPSTDKERFPEVFTWAPATGSSQARSAGSAGWPPSPRHHSPACQGVTVAILLCHSLIAALRPARGTAPPSLVAAPLCRDT